MLDNKTAEFPSYKLVVRLQVMFALSMLFWIILAWTFPSVIDWRHLHEFAILWPLVMFPLGILLPSAVFILFNGFIGIGVLGEKAHKKRYRVTCGIKLSYTFAAMIWVLIFMLLVGAQVFRDWMFYIFVILLCMLKVFAVALFVFEMMFSIKTAKAKS